ncbi:MAG: TonB-dependent receptor [Calditrichaeota bacterium]|nr:MAG: TonB-dependent receptor [Calditrichota bacterium]
MRVQYFVNLNFWFIFLIVVLYQIDVSAQNKIKFSGKILDRETRQSLQGVEIFISNTTLHAISDKRGEFAITVPPGNHIIKLKMMGYQEFSDTIHIPLNVTRFYQQFLMVPIVYRGETVFVVAERFKSNLNPMVHSISIPMMNKIPIFAEADPFRAMQYLPGITSINDYSGELYLQGGNSDQTMILYDGVPVFNPYHLGGLFSTFNMDNIERIDLHPAGYGAAFGEGLSGIVNIIPRTEISRTKKFKASIGLLNSKVFTQFPLGKGTLGIAARRTYFDVVSRIIKEPNAYYFYDIQGNYSFSFGKNNFFALSTLFSKDVLKNTNISPKAPSWGNWILSLQWKRVLKKIFYLESQIYLSQSVMNAQNDRSNGQQINVDNYVQTQGWKGHLFLESGNHVFQSGFDLKQISIHYQWRIFNAYDLENFIDPPQNAFFDYAPPEYRYRKKPIFYALFFQDNFRLNQKLFIIPAVRATYSSLSENIDWQPRFSIRYVVNPIVNFQFSYGTYYQYMYTLKQNDGKTIIRPFSVLFVSDRQDGTQPLKANHYVGKIEFRIQPNLFGEIVLYHKSLFRIPTVMNELPHFKRYPHTASGFSLLVKKEKGLFNGWVGYNYSKSIVKTSFPFPAGYERRHSLKVVLTLSFPKGWEFSSNFFLTSGLPYTPVIGVRTKIIDPSSLPVPETIYGDINSAHFPAYHRLDIGIVKKWGNKKNHTWELRFQIFNIYNHKNPLYYDKFSVNNEFNLPLVPTINLSYKR